MSGLSIWRHRFVLGCCTWELPGGYVDSDEVHAVTAARRETGWRPRSMTLLTQFQALVDRRDPSTPPATSARATYQHDGRRRPIVLRQP
ncbi:MAG: NUDIX domain-containing protein [Pseudonocardiaceae bacterium]